MPKKKKLNYVFIVGTCLTLVTIWIMYSGQQFDIQKNQASIDYWIYTPDWTRFYYEGYNTVSAQCRNGGGMDGSFYLILRLRNATVSPEQNFAVNATMVKIPFVLHKSGASGDEGSETVSFAIDKGVTGFSISISLEKQDQNPLKATNYKYTVLQCELNKDLNYFGIVD
jgi:hypothetical protein